MSEPQTPSRLPIVVGITGKRDLKDRDTAVSAALAAILKQLDDIYPRSPKVMLSALADGADRLAALAAQGRAGWQVVAPLPLALDQYKEDFDGASKDWIDAFLGRSGVDHFALPPLTDPQTGGPYGPAALARQPNGNPLRATHYEQVGQFIAECSTLLIAVMPADEKPDKTGGTARIAKYKLEGAFDAAAQAVAAQSLVVAVPSPLDVAPAGTVWVVDLDAPDQVAVRSNLEARDGDFARSLPLAARIEEFNRRLMLAGETAVLDSGARSAGAVLLDLGAGLSRVQGAARDAVRRSIWTLALLSFFAISSFELFAARVHLPVFEWSVLFYFLFAVAAILVYRRARNRRWQPVAEEYRAVAESLRVQKGWWDAGLTHAAHRTDRFYLEGARGSLGMVREAIRACIHVARLLGMPPDPDPAACRAWIEGQVNFFTKRIGERRRALTLVEARSWFLFLGSFGGLAMAIVLQGAFEEPVNAVTGFYARYVPAGMLVAADAVIALLLVLYFARLYAPAPATAGASRRIPQLKWRSWLGAFALGLALAAGVCDAIHLLGLGEGHEREAAQDLIGALAIMAAAFAGALRYASEKLSWDAELNGYEEAVEFFERAHKKIDATADPAARDAIVLEVGKKALAESERWLRAHRERPLEPVVGG